MGPMSLCTAPTRSLRFRKPGSKTLKSGRRTSPETPSWSTGARRPKLPQRLRPMLQKTTSTARMPPRRARVAPVGRMLPASPATLRLRVGPALRALPLRLPPPRPPIRSGVTHLQIPQLSSRIPLPSFPAPTGNLLQTHCLCQPTLWRHLSTPFRHPQTLRP